MNEWNIEWMDDDEWINGWMDKEMNEWNIGWMDDVDWIIGLMDKEWMNEILNKCMDG